MNPMGMKNQPIIISQFNFHKKETKKKKKRERNKGRLYWLGRIMSRRQEQDRFESTINLKIIIINKKKEKKEWTWMEENEY